MSNNYHDYIAKVLLIGNSGAGKTCILTRFMNEDLKKNHIATIGIDFRVRTVEFNGTKIKLQIWDTAGQERYGSITHAYYRGAHGVMLVYDATDEKSYEQIKYWLSAVEENAPANIKKILIGNKCDLEDQKTVSKEEGEKLASKHNIEFLETSAVLNVNIEEAFSTLARGIYTNIFQEMHTISLEEDSTLDISKPPKKQNKKIKKFKIRL
ncbi:ras-related protein Rab-8-like [Aphidius gifuensis]|uniref:ras-related protein Rab-8-like n=1 Tax=Aphidius gifuensis TaxID=684658 RepID=UPI001CDBE33E|nr:ras-related protein Rab-8-like [Aphidius gifuensis]